MKGGKRVLFLLAIMIGGYFIYVSLTVAQDRKDLVAKKPQATEEAISAGKKVYDRWCWFCHGSGGAGDGPAADYMNPRPRDFTTGVYKLRTTESGGLPTDEDLFRTISRGIPGTAMPAWEGYLTETERWQVIFYIKRFSEDFSDPELDPYKIMVKVNSNVPLSPESVARGEEVYKKAKCWECHGERGKGDGPSAIEGLKDDWGFLIRPFDLTKGWKFKGESTPNDIFYRFTTGVNGTPMPSYVDTLTEEERWHLANYVASLNEGQESGDIILKSRYIEGEIPKDINDPVWRELPSLRIPMAGQIFVKPRWENPAVDLVKISSVFNDKEIAFFLEWDDPAEDLIHQEDIKVALDPNDTYVKPSALPRKRGVFRDSIALQFPVKIPEGPVKPHFLGGNPANPVNLWIWKSDTQKKGEWSPVEEVNAKGIQSPPSPQPKESQSARGIGVWKDGGWKAIIVRSVNTKDASDIQFERGKVIPIALNAWDGSNGEHGLIMSISSWSYLFLEARTPMRIYGYAFLTFISIAILEIFLIRKSKGYKIDN